MRIIITFLLFVVIGCYADDMSDITIKTFDKTNKNGTISYRMVTTYRGKQRIMIETFRPNSQGVMVVSARSYLVGGDIVLTESDEHKSGKFDTIAVYHPGTDEMEVFIRLEDGSVTPASTQVVQAYKKRSEGISKFIDTTYDDKK
jgi:hypothetical protein